MTEQHEQPSAELLQQFRDGSESAATTLFDRYVERLTRLARLRLSAKLAQRIDAEDVVLSAYRSFFLAARCGRFSVNETGDLWRLLVRMTFHKLYRQSARHTAERRSIEREQRERRSSSGVEFVEQVADREPTPDEALAVADELESVMRRLDTLPRRVLELRLQGETFADIASAVERSERHVRRVMATIRTSIAKLAGDAGLSTAESDLSTNDENMPSNPHQTNSRIALPAEKLMKNGERLKFADYLLQQQLGWGASGKVYRALQKPTGRTVAVKFLRKDILANDRLVQRFIAEAAIVSQFDHPGIVRIHGIGQTPNGGLFLVQDWIDGPNLAEHCAANRPDWRTALGWLAEAAVAVHHAHERNIIHCDLKPANLLLGPDGRVRITDFGLARRIDDHTRPHAIAGTLGSMAPEQVDACWGTVGPTTDVYGLGAVLFELIVGHPPVKPGRPADMLTTIVIGTPHPSVKSFCDSIPDELAAIVDRCLSKSPQHRFASAASVAKALLAVGSQSG